MLTVVSQKGLRKSLFSLQPLGKLYSFLKGVCVCVCACAAVRCKGRNNSSLVKGICIGPRSARTVCLLCSGIIKPLSPAIAEETRKRGMGRERERERDGFALKQKTERKANNEKEKVIRKDKGETA